MTDTSTLKPVQRDHFPNYAGVKDIDDALASELEAAGIEVHRLGFLKNGKSEVDTEVVGDLHGWGFRRAWRYWIAEGPGIELAAADRLHASHGRDVRVNGHCGCPTPRDQFKGLAVGSYHVDRPSGLKALADTIRDLVERAASPAGFRDGSFQERNAAWMAIAFEGDPTDLAERVARFGEESLELQQALGLTREDAHRLVDYVFDRPAGTPATEFGQAHSTLALLATFAGHDLQACGEAELARVSTPEFIAKLRGKRATRHGRGPLPGFSAPGTSEPPAAVEVDRG